jgi:hypothetical protein
MVLPKPFVYSSKKDIIRLGGVSENDNPNLESVSVHAIAVCKQLLEKLLFLKQ